MPDLLAICYYLALLLKVCSLFPLTIMTFKKAWQEKKSIFMELFEDLSLDLSHTQTRTVRKLKLRSILILEIIKGQWHQISEIKNVIITSWYLILLEQQGKRPAYTLQSKHFTFCSCTLTFCSKHLIPWNLEGFYIFASKSEGNRLQLPVLSSTAWTSTTFQCNCVLQGFRELWQNYRKRMQRFTDY